MRDIFDFWNKIEAVETTELWLQTISFVNRHLGGRGCVGNRFGLLVWVFFTRYGIKQHHDLNSLYQDRVLFSLIIDNEIYPFLTVNPESRSSRHSISGEQHNDHMRSHRVNSLDTSESSRDSFHLRDSRESRDGSTVSRDNSRDSCGAASREQHHKSFDKSRPGDCNVSTSTNNSTHQGSSARMASSSGNNGLPVEQQDYKREGLQSAMDIKKTGMEGQRRRRTDSQGSQRYQGTVSLSHAIKVYLPLVLMLLIYYFFYFQVLV